MPQAYSITSRPRVTSPSASESTLPCSAVRIRATSSRRSCTSSRIVKSSSARFASDTARHFGKAAFAACDRRVDLLHGREVDLAGLPSGRRVVDGAAAAGRAGHALAVDPVRETGDLRPALRALWRGDDVGHRSSSGAHGGA